MDSKKILETLVKIANNQQKIIHKLAQTNTDLTVGDSHPQAPTAPTATGITPVPVVHKDPATAIIQALGNFYSAVVNGLSVNSQANAVEVSFKPGKATQPNYDHVLKTVQNLQNSKVLMGGPYKVTVVA